MSTHTVGYTDRIGVISGERVRLMVSTTDEAVDVSLVRLIHADERGPGLKAEPVASDLDGTYPAAEQPLRFGSSVRVEDVACPPSFTVTLWIFPTRLSAGEQALIATGGWELCLIERAALRLDVGPSGSVSTGFPLRERVWHFVAATVDGETGRIEMLVVPSDAWTHPSQASGRAGPESGSSGPLLIAGALTHEGHIGRTFNGKVARPRLYARAMTRPELERERVEPAPDPIAAWDFSLGTASRRIVDVSGNGLDGVTLQMPARLVAGPDGAFDAIHFHDDDLDDAGWTPTVEWTVPAELPSGIYAAHLRTQHAGEDYVPIVVGPPRGSATADILFVAPLFSWLAYGNQRLGFELSEEIPEAASDHARYLMEHRLTSLYDVHSDGSGIGYASWLRPIVDMRPNRFTDPSDAHQFAADLHLVDWLHHEGHAFDVVTDLDVHREGAEILGRYRVVLSGTHAEYWTGPMLDALEGYLAGGGRYMYLSGNGLYCVTGFDPSEEHTIEVRRYGAATSAWHAAPGERFLSTTGEEGGLWRFRGRAPQRYVGVGFAGCLTVPPKTVTVGVPYRRQPGSHDLRAAFVFDGLGPEAEIGAFPNLVFQTGAVGFEFDRVDHALGSPPHTLVLASATEFGPDHYMGALEEYPRYNMRADMAFFETPAGGAVFSTGSISWCGALSYNGYDNTVSRITGNVLLRFLSPDPFEMA